MEDKPKIIDDAGEKSPDSGNENWNMTPEDPQEPEVTEAEVEPVEDIEAVEADSPAAKEQAADIIEAWLPNGTHFRGTREEYNQEVRDWLDNVS